MAASSSSETPVVIKKYGNRRLYDTSQSRYITLDDLAAIVKDGTTVRVVEASTDRDLTRQVLTQVILEQQDALDMIPIELLHALIRVRGTLEQAPFSAFLATITRQFVQSGNIWSQQLTNFFGATPFSPGEAQTESSSAAEPSATAHRPAEKPAEAPTDSPREESAGDIRKRMDALLGKLGKS